MCDDNVIEDKYHRLIASWNKELESLSNSLVRIFHFLGQPSRICFLAINENHFVCNIYISIRRKWLSHSANQSSSIFGLRTKRILAFLRDMNFINGD